MRELLSRFMPEGSFARNVGMLTGGTAFAQALTVLALPLLTRLYTPEDFELLAVYVAVLSMVTVVSSLRYNIAIPLPEEDRHGMALLVLSLLCAAAVSALLATFVWLFPAIVADRLGQPSLMPYLWMVPLGVFLAAVYGALQYWSSRKKRFALITRTRVTRATGGIGAQAAVGFFAPSPFGLIFGHMLYGGLGVLGLARDLVLKDREALERIGLRQIKARALEYRRFPLWSVPESLFNTASIQLPLILIAASTAGPEAGFLMLAMRVMGVPMALVGSSVAQVFLAEAPKKYREGSLLAFTRHTMSALLKTGGPPLVAVGILSPILFPLIFGPSWQRAGSLVAWMTPWFVLQFVASPVSMVLHVTSKQGVATAMQLFGLIIRFGALMLFIPEHPALLPEVYALSGLVFYFVYIYVIYAVLRTQERGLAS